jgi:uncharacterized Zn finger protein
LESFSIGARLGRGRSYARTGQVLSIEVGKGRVKARVQGSRPKPYEVTIHIKTLSPADWRTLTKALSRRAIFVAKLLAGEMPLDIEKVFKNEGLSVFPEKEKDLRTSCSCPDWSNPCKHIAAVYYLLGEAFDRDPFLIFKLRGMEREELTGMLGSPEKRRAKKKDLPKPIPPGKEVEKSAASEPLPLDISKFWNGAGLAGDLFGAVRIPPVSAALLKRLGNFPFWRGEQRFFDVMERVYTQAASRGMNVFLGEKDSLELPRDESKVLGVGGLTIDEFLHNG